jgi:hypothetical protein
MSGRGRRGRRERPAGRRDRRHSRRLRGESTRTGRGHRRRGRGGPLARARRRPDRPARGGTCRRTHGAGAVRGRGIAPRTLRLPRRGCVLLHTLPAQHPVVRGRPQTPAGRRTGRHGRGRRPTLRRVPVDGPAGGAHAGGVASVRRQPATCRAAGRGDRGCRRDRRGLAAHRAVRRGATSAARRPRGRRVHGPRDPAAGARPARRRAAGDDPVRPGRRAGLRRTGPVAAGATGPLRHSDRLVGLSDPDRPRLAGGGAGGLRTERARSRSGCRRTAPENLQPAQQRSHPPAGRALGQLAVRRVGPGR